ncbi:MAG: hypothetical protein LBC68_10760 [Prevotellaceae bacterium]|jgi:hypothetical protein|nr:hypothetical protein [Prevotellaceae bacterium]
MTTMITIISSVSAIAAAISAFFSYKNSKTTLNLFEKEKYEKLKEELNKIIEISIRYPYVESKNFTSKWLEYKESDDERYLRYDMYCNRFYNHLHNICEHFNYDKQKIEDFVDVKSWIRLHKLNWLNPVDENENIDGYDKQFRDYINLYLI